MNEAIHVILFFTYNVSLKIWAESGLLKREIAIYRKLIEKGVKVSFITYGDEGDYDYADELGDINIFPFFASVKRPRSKILRILKSLLLPFVFRKHLKNASLYKTNQIWGGWNAVIAKWLYRKPLIARCGYEPYSFALKQGHNFFIRNLIRLEAQFVYSFSDIICMAAAADREFIIKKFHTPGDKIRVTGNYVDTELFCPIELEKFDDRVLFVGRLDSQKNLFSLIKAVHAAGCRLDIIGNGVLENELKKFAVEKEAEVEFIPPVSNDKLPGIINRYPVFALCSHFEGTPKALIEAMSCGAAVLGSDVEGIRDLVSDGENGMLCGTSADSICESLKKLISDEKLRLKLGTAARESITGGFSLLEAAEKEMELYGSLVDKAV